MVALQGYEGPLSWLFLHLLLIAIPGVAFFLVGRRGRLHLWHVAALVLLTALLLLPAVAFASISTEVRRDWLSVMGIASGSPGVYVMGMHATGWATMLVALSLRYGLGVVLLRSGRRDRIPKRRPLATPADA